MEKFALRAKRRRHLAVTNTFETVLKAHRRIQRSAPPVQCLSDHEGNSIQPIDVPCLQLSYYQGIYDYQVLPTPNEVVFNITREQLLCLSEAAATTRLRGNLNVGPDGLTAELLHDLQVQQIDELLALAVSPHITRPTSWNNIPVSVLPKPFAKTIFQNRLIAAQAASHKLYLHALKTVILRDIGAQLDPLMGGIRSGDVVGAWISRLNVAVSKDEEWGIPLYLGCVDIARAFATVDHAFLLRAAEALGVQPTWVSLLHRELISTNIDLHVKGEWVGTIQMQRGLVEGLPPSSLLLGIFLTFLWRRLRVTETYSEHCMQFPNDFGVCPIRLHAAGWVDDWTMASGTRNGLQSLITLFANALRELGMSLALEKVSWMAAGVERPSNMLYLEGNEIPRSGELIFLGALISIQGALNHLDYRYRKMLGKWGFMQRTLRTCSASTAISLQAAVAVALPSLLWAMETHPITGNVILKMHSCFLVVLRSLFPKCGKYDEQQWIYMHSRIRSWFREGKLISPACFLYKRQETLYKFLKARPEFDLNLLMDWRSNAWLASKSRSTRPARRFPGSPPKQLESEFHMREGYSLDFRALSYAQRFNAAPF